MTAEPDPPEELCVKLRAAADRLLAGTPLRSSGKLTILDLAREAQVKRWLLTHKYPNKLMAKYQAEFKAAQHKPEPLQKAEREIAALREELAEARKEKRRLAELVQTYAVMIEQLATERAQAIEEREAAIAARGAALEVSRIPRPLSRQDESPQLRRRRGGGPPTGTAPGSG